MADSPTSFGSLLAGFVPDAGPAPPEISAIGRQPAASFFSQTDWEDRGARAASAGGLVAMPLERALGAINWNDEAIAPQPPPAPAAASAAPAAPTAPAPAAPVNNEPIELLDNTSPERRGDEHTTGSLLDAFDW